MNIKSVKLANDMNGNLCNLCITTNDGKVLFVPLDEANTDYQEYIKWTKLSPANVAAPADE